MTNVNGVFDTTDDSRPKIRIVHADKIGSASSPLPIGKTVAIVSHSSSARPGDVVVVRALTDNATYNMLELPNGRLAKINLGDLLIGVLGRRRALKGFVGDVPSFVATGDHLHLLNMGGVIGQCTGHHSSMNEAIKLEVIGLACDEAGRILNIADAALSPRHSLGASVPLVMIAGTCMNSGKTFVATELIKQATRAGFRAAGAKLSGVACLRDTLNMTDHGAIATASFLDCGLPSTVGIRDLGPIAKAVIARLNETGPDLIVVEMGDGILGGYSVESVFDDPELQAATAAIVFCASDYVGAWGGVELFRRRGLNLDVIAGSVTDSAMGQDYIEKELGVAAANARRNVNRLFEIVWSKVKSHSENLSAAVCLV